MNKTAVVILAAGKGTRMHSDLPKVLHEVAGKPLLQHVIETAKALSADSIHVVYGHGGQQVREQLASHDVGWVEQAQRRGTGHALLVALPEITEDVVLVLYGDVPLIQADTLRAFVALANNSTLALMTQELDDPTGYGRIVRDTHGRVLRIVEEKDANARQRDIREVNTGILALPREFLVDVLPRLSCDNSQGEYYLTDVIAEAVDAGLAVETVSPRFSWEVDGVNDRVQLAKLERTWQSHQAEILMQSGVTLRDPARLDVRGQLIAGRDVVLDVNVIVEGRVELGEGVHIGPNVVLRDAIIGPGSTVLAGSVIEGAVIGRDSKVGPMARLRPGTRLADDTCIGNFVEVKNTSMGVGSKANHLAYLGDAHIGAAVNIGAGTITCNYDGANKNTTRIGDNVFVGSNTSLVAPLTLLEGSTIGAGSVIVKDVGEGDLAISRGKQRNISGWSRPEKAGMKPGQED